MFATLLDWAGPNVPDDRVIDGIDQPAFFGGEQELSARDGFLAVWTTPLRRDVENPARFGRRVKREPLISAGALLDCVPAGKVWSERREFFVARRVFLPDRFKFYRVMLLKEAPLHAASAMRVGILDNSTQDVRSKQYRGEIKCFLKKGLAFSTPQAQSVWVTSPYNVCHPSMSGKAFRT